MFCGSKVKCYIVYYFLANDMKLTFLYPPEASGGYFGLAFATRPPPRVERFSALTL